MYLCFARRTPSPISSHINSISLIWLHFLWQTRTRRIRIDSDSSLSLSYYYCCCYCCCCFIIFFVIPLDFVQYETTRSRNNCCYDVIIVVISYIILYYIKLNITYCSTVQHSTTCTNSKEQYFQKKVCVQQLFQKRRTLFSKYYLCKEKIFRNLGAYDSVFKKGELFLKVLHMPQNELYMNCTKTPGYSPYMVHVWFKYSSCTIWVQFMYSSNKVLVQFNPFAV